MKFVIAKIKSLRIAIISNIWGALNVIKMSIEGLWNRNEEEIQDHDSNSEVLDSSVNFWQNLNVSDEISRKKCTDLIEVISLPGVRKHN